MSSIVTAPAGDSCSATSRFTHLRDTQIQAPSGDEPGNLAGDERRRAQQRLRGRDRTERVCARVAQQDASFLTQYGAVELAASVARVRSRRCREGSSDRKSSFAAALAVCVGATSRYCRRDFPVLLAQRAHVAREHCAGSPRVATWNRLIEGRPSAAFAAVSARARREDLPRLAPAILTGRTRGRAPVTMH